MPAAVRAENAPFAEQAQPSPETHAAPSDPALQTGSVKNVPEALRESVKPLSLSAVVSAQERPVSLEEALTAATRQNLSLRQTQTRLRAQKWQFANQLSEFLPDVTPLFLNRQTVNGAFIVSGAIPVSVDARTYVLGSTVQMRVFHGFQTLLNSAAERQRYRAARAEVSRSEADILLETFQRYDALQLAKVRIAVAESRQREANSLLKVTQSKFQEGLVPKLEVFQAQAQVASAEETLVNAVNGYQLASADLAASLGQSLLEVLTPTTDRLQPALLIEPTLTLNQLVSVAQTQRPELQRDALLVKAERAARLAVLGQYLPDVTASYTTQASGLNLQEMKNAQITQLNLNWVLGRAGVGPFVRYQQARVRTEQAELTLLQTRQQVEADVVSAFYDMQNRQASIRLADSRLAAESERLRLAWLRHREGLMTTTDLINAQTQTADAQYALAEVIVGYNAAQARLLRAIGAVSAETLLASEGPWRLPASGLPQAGSPAHSATSPPPPLQP
jgi:outer membrane protein